MEFIVTGTPLSLQASPRGKNAWKARVRSSAEAALQAGHERIDFINVSVRIVHYCFEWGDGDGDLDNIAKPILDAMCGVSFFNDNQVRELHLRRTDLSEEQITEVKGATPLLAASLEPILRSPDGVGFVYVAVSDVIEHGRLP